MTMTNVNCLEGMKCPCGSYGPFGIACDNVMLVSDAGVLDNIGDYDWNDDAYCECRSCMRTGKVGDFKTPTPSQEAASAMKTLVDRLNKLTKEHEQLENERDKDYGDCGGYGGYNSGMSDEQIDRRENEIFEECFEIAQDIVDLNPYA